MSAGVVALPAFEHVDGGPVHGHADRVHPAGADRLDELQGPVIADQEHAHVVRAAVDDREHPAPVAEGHPALRGGGGTCPGPSGRVRADLGQTAPRVGPVGEHLVAGDLVCLGVHGSGVGPLTVRERLGRGASGAEGDHSGGGDAGARGGDAETAPNAEPVTGAPGERIIGHWVSSFRAGTADRPHAGTVTGPPKGVTPHGQETVIENTFHPRLSVIGEVVVLVSCSPTTNLEVPVPVGVPETTPVDPSSESPDGSVPVPGSTSQV